jgi:ATP-dependent RNA helicase DeaD
MTHITSFADFGLSPELNKAIEEKGYIVPSDIQAQVIPLFLSWERDIIGQAQTGSGKTASFALPIIEKLDIKDRKTQAIVLAPTRELAIQVAREFESFGKYKNFTVALVYGGQFISKEMRVLESGAQVVIGTPGRVRDHLKRGSIKLDSLRYFVLDEADEMLNIGFKEEVEEILATTPKEKRVLLFSATMPPQILRIAQTYMGQYDLVKMEKKQESMGKIEQGYYDVRPSDKLKLLTILIEMNPDMYGIIFCQRKIDCDEVAAYLMGHDIKAEAMHSDIDQKKREAILKRLRERKIQFLVATDVAARGIDIQDLSHVINFSLPENAETYTHRVGRTGRAGKDGIAINFVTRMEQRKLFYIEKLMKQPIKKLPIPAAEEVKKLKKDLFLKSLDEKISHGVEGEIAHLARELTEKYEAEKLIAYLLDKSLPKKFFEATEISKHDSREGYGRDSWSRDWGSRSSSSERPAGGFTLRTRDGAEKTFGAGRESSSRDTSYPRRESSRGDSETMRLFVARGKKDRLFPKDVLGMIEADCELSLNYVKKVEIYDSFSYLDVNRKDGDIITQTYKKKNRIKPLIVEAKRKG